MAVTWGKEIGLFELDLNSTDITYTVLPQHFFLNKILIKEFFYKNVLNLKNQKSYHGRDLSIKINALFNKFMHISANIVF